MKNINEEEILSVTEELDHLLREMDNMTYPERKEVREKLEQMLMEMQRESVFSELSTEQRMLLAEGLRELGQIYRGDFEYPEDTDVDARRAWELYRQAKEIYDGEFGKGNYASWKVASILSVITIDSGINSAESMQILQEILAINEKNPEADVARIADSYKRMAEISSKWEHDIDKAIAYYQPYLKESRERYGEESDFVADCYEEIARLCENCDDIPLACEYTERALTINIREMGKMYLLPPIFRKMVVGVMKKIGKIDEEEKFNRIMSVSDNYGNLGNRYLSLGKAQRAKDCLEKSIALYEMVMRVSTYDHGLGHELLGNCLLSLEEKEKARQEYRTAWQIYHDIMIRNMERDDRAYKWETEECKAGMERLSAKLQ